MAEQNMVCQRHHWSQLDALNHTMLDGFQQEPAECPYCRLRLRDDRIAELERGIRCAVDEWQDWCHRMLSADKAPVGASALGKAMDALAAVVDGKGPRK